MEPLFKGSELLRKLLNDYLAGKIETTRFCADIEAAYNDAIDRSALTPVEQEAFESLFDEVVWFSPEPKDVWEYPSHGTAEQIRAEALKAVAQLNQD